MRTSRTRRLIFTGAAALGVVAGAAGIAAAATSTSSSTPAESKAEADNTQDPSYTSSVTAPEGKDGTSETDESAALQGLAKVTADQAKAAALAAVPGTAATPQLENENGNVVWAVEVTGADGKVTDVKVDAGDGKVLQQDAADGNESKSEGSEKPDANETPDANEPATH